jgi:lipoprotein-anchoring transpeptidase ErfK/SrfK
MSRKRSAVCHFSYDGQEKTHIMNRPAARTSRNEATFRRFAALAIFAAFAVSRATAQSTAQLQAKPASQPTRRIVVSIPDRKLALLENDHAVKIYDVAVGASVSPSPDGEYQVAQRLENPTYYHPGVVIGPGATNPLGPRWIGLNVKGFGIHGTNHPESIGKNASHGCLRLRNRDIEDLFARVKVGDRVSLIAERNDEVARLFGPTPDSTHAAQTMVAKNEPAPATERETQGDR